MPLRAELSRHCQTDLQQAFDFYEQRKPGLGLEFISDFERFIIGVSTHPELGVKTHGRLRKFVLTQFPYVAYYSVADDHVRVVACIYGGQKPQEIEDALKERSE